MPNSYLSLNIHKLIFDEERSFYFIVTRVYLLFNPTWKKTFQLRNEKNFVFFDPRIKFPDIYTKLVPLPITSDEERSFYFIVTLLSNLRWKKIFQLRNEENFFFFDPGIKFPDITLLPNSHPSLFVNLLLMKSALSILSSQFIFFQNRRWKKISQLRNEKNFVFFDLGIKFPDIMLLPNSYPFLFVNENLFLSDEERSFYFIVTLLSNLRWKKIFQLRNEENFFDPGIKFPDITLLPNSYPSLNIHKLTSDEERSFYFIVTRVYLLSNPTRKKENFPIEKNEAR